MKILWMNCGCNSIAIRGVLEKDESQTGVSLGVDGAKFFGREQACANAIQFAPREGDGCEILSLKDTLSIEDSPYIGHFICIVQKCREAKNLAYAKRVYKYICDNRLEAHRVIGNYVVPTLVECGSLSEAQHVFDRLVHPNEHSWTSLIQGYIKCGQAEHALNLYQQMQQHGICPRSRTLMALLKACARLKDVERGQEIHADITGMGLARDLFLSSTLVDMYAKCGSLLDAWQVSNRLPRRDSVLWNTLLAGCAECGCGQEALHCFEQMQVEGFPPDAITFVCILKACGSLGAISRGQEIHAQIARMGFERDLFVGSTLVSMYAKCGSLAEAQEVFVSLPVRDAVSWNTLLAGYADHGPGQEVLTLFEQMQLEGISPDAVTFACVLKACGSVGAIGKGQEIHAEITRKGFGRDFVLGSALVDMYAKCGTLLPARQVFDKLPFRDVVSWNSLITGYAEHGPCEELLNSFERMQLEGVCPNAATFICVLNTYCSMGDIAKGREIHAELTQKGFEEDLCVSNTLVHMYAKCGSILEAQEVFNSVPVRDVLLWNALAAGYAEHGPDMEVLKCFEQIQSEGISPNALMYVSVLKACGSMQAIGKGREIHSEIMQKGFGRDLSVGNTVVGMYAKCSSLSESREAFNKLLVREVVWWNALIAGYAEHGSGKEVLKCFEQMQLEGVPPNAITFMCVLKACGSMGAIGKGREIHAEVFQMGFGRDLVVGSALVTMYAKCGLLLEARNAFNKLPVRSVVSWNTLIAGYAEYGPGKEALKCFEQMQTEGVPPDVLTFVYVSKVCGVMGAIERAREMHMEIAQKGYRRDLPLCNTLVDMYAKYGSLSEAQEVFDELSVRDVASWTALINGYGMNHDGNMAVQYFEDMQEQGEKPDAIMSTSFLTACSHTDLVFKGQEYFKVMRTDYGIVPTTEHYTCMVDLFARSGYLCEAEELLEGMCCHPSEGMRTALLSACKTYREVELGLRLFQKLVQTNPKSAGSYALMANIYASAGSWYDAYLIEDLRKHQV